MDKKGYVMSSLSFLLVIPVILMTTVFIDIAHQGEDSVGLVLKSDSGFYVAKDVEGNVPVTTEQVLQNTAEDLIKTGKPLQNSRETVKNDLQSRMDDLTQEYQKNTGAKVACIILSVDSSPDPFGVQVKFTIWVEKDRVIHNETICQDVSITDSDHPIPDPLPFLMVNDYGGATNNTKRIIYGPSLVNYLNAKGTANATVYQNATSPLFIKKCPYDPYIYHGRDKSLITLKNCIDNGYFHESSDGACFLCRLEGKATCPHYGFETFITPALNSNSTLITAPCSIDHVLFNTTSYPGEGVIYYSDGESYYKIFLDNGHRQKYGLPTY